jgi:hypothetical protein
MAATDSFDDFSTVAKTLRLSLWVRILQVVGLWGCPLFFATALMAFSIFDYLPWYANAIIICVFLLVYWAWASSFASLAWVVLFSKQSSVKKEFYESLLDGDELEEDEPMKENRLYNAKASLFSVGLRQGIPLVVGFLLIFGTCWFFSSACMTFEPITLSFKGMRVLSSETCQPGLKPCLVYLNVADNSSSTMFVVFHATYKMTTPVVKLSISSQPSPLDYEITVPAEYIEMNLEVTRFVYMAYLSHLDPHRIHFFVAGDGQVVDSYSAERQFRPTDWSLQHHPLRFISGGDVGLGKTADTLLTLAASKEPSFMVFGGDLAYANGMKTCYRRWDLWLKKYIDAAVTPSGLTIPMLTAIGNHEAGGFNMKRSQSPFYLNYFFHQGFNTVPETVVKSPNVDPATKFKPSNVPPNTYHTHDVAGNTFIILDSDILAPAGGAQREWLASTLNASRCGPRPSQWTLAAYHSPLYPSVRSQDNYASKLLRKAWGDIFSQFRLDLAMENHDHAYKRSFPIKDGAVAPPGQHGTVFIGDGAMGVTPRKPAPIHKRDYLVVAEQETFFFMITMMHNNITIRAINEQNSAFDYHVITRRP